MGQRSARMFVAAACFLFLAVVPVFGQQAKGTTGVQSPAKAAIKPSVPAVPAGMTNADVIKLVKAGLSDAVVVTSIKQAPERSFTLSADGLVELKMAGVSDRIIHVMLDPTATVEPTTPTENAVVAPAAVPAAPATPTVEREPGIYVQMGSDLVPLEPAFYTGEKRGSLLMTMASQGFKRPKWKVVVRGHNAHLRLSDRQPTFFFYFEAKNNSRGGGFVNSSTGPSSPDEFMLVKMDQGGKERELTIDETVIGAGQVGMKRDESVEMKVEKVGAGVYKATPAKELKDGEYCFFYTQGSQANAGKVFDFGVDR